MIAKNNTINGLSEALSILWNNISLRNKLSQGSISIMAKHPTWQQVSEQWIYLLNNQSLKYLRYGKGTK